MNNRGSSTFKYHFVKKETDNQKQNDETLSSWRMYILINSDLNFIYFRCGSNILEWRLALVEVAQILV